jgi:hypothetical protein
MVQNIEKKTLSVVLRRKNPEDEKRTLLVDITDVVSNISNVVSKILTGPLRLIVDNLNIDYKDGNIIINGDQVGDREMHWEDAKEDIHAIINNNK